jgi:hypothetical protein
MRRKPVKYRIEKNIYWPMDYEFKKGNTATVVVEFTVNEEGKVVDAEVYTPLH